MHDRRANLHAGRELIEKQATCFRFQKIEQFLEFGKLLFFPKQACRELPFEGIGYPQKIRG